MHLGDVARALGVYPFRCKERVEREQPVAGDYAFVGHKVGPVLLLALEVRKSPHVPVVPLVRDAEAEAPEPPLDAPSAPDGQTPPWGPALAQP